MFRLQAAIAAEPVLHALAVVAPLASPPAAGATPGTPPNCARVRDLHTVREAVKIALKTTDEPQPQSSVTAAVSSVVPVSHHGRTGCSTPTTPTTRNTAAAVSRYQKPAAGRTCNVP